VKFELDCDGNCLINRFITLSHQLFAFGTAGKISVKESIDKLVRDVVKDVSQSYKDFSQLHPYGLQAYPIPFFGEPDKAQVLTIGVNPSAGEFRGRDWPSGLTESELAFRLTTYFENEKIKPHPWFRTWERGLRRLGYSYLDGHAAHTDISPRVTVSMGQCDPDIFLRMCFRDIQWMFRLLTMLQPKGLLMAGTVTKLHYMNDFIDLAAKSHGWKMEGNCDSKGHGRIGFHNLVKDNISFPVFFCSVSPSSRNGSEMLLRRIEENSTRIRGLFNGI
jgi:hypothetical protein